VVSPRNPVLRAGTVTVNPPNSYEVSRELLARNIKIDYRQNAGIRIAPHFYNTDEEVHQAMNTIDEILSDGSWKKHAVSRDFVT
jgi:kynureninase